MNFGELQSNLSKKLGTTETINFTDAKRRQAINDTFSNYIQKYYKWSSLRKERPITFRKTGRLFTGVTIKDAYTDWTSITDGSFRITIDGTAYNIDAIDFSAATSMATVASTIQTAIRAITSGLETVSVYDNYFVITSGTTGSTSSVTILSTSTGTVGTDISGINYLNANSTVYAQATTYSTASIPSDYDEMIRLYERDGNGYSGYDWTFNHNFSNRSDLTWTVKDLLGTKVFMIYSEENITLTAEYRKKLTEMTASLDTTGMDSDFDEPATLWAAATLLKAHDAKDPRIAGFMQDANYLMEGLFVRDMQDSERSQRRLKTKKRNHNLYSYGR